MSARPAETLGHGDPRYALIVGHGRSGSNWVLSMLHASEQVHARNEPHLLGGSPYAALPDVERLNEDGRTMAEAWDTFASWASHHDGERDPHTDVEKTFVRRWATRTGAVDWPVRPRIRQVLRVGVPALRQPEWRPLRSLVDRARHDTALHVLKVNDVRFWHLRWVLEQRPDVPVIHLVRHPGGYLRSAWSRFFGPLDDAGRRSEEQVYRDALGAAVRAVPHWHDAIGEVSSLSLAEAVMWFWRINNEEIHHAGAGRRGHRMVRYEDLVAEPVEVAQELFAHLGMPFTPTAEHAVRDGLSRSVWGPVQTSTSDRAEGWREALSAEHLALVERMLADGPMSTWW